MNKSNFQAEQLRWHHRLMHFLLCLLAFIMMGLLLVIGSIMTTNIMTQLNHAETWLYVAVFIVCCLIIGVGLVLLYKTMAKHFLLAGAGLKSTE